MSDGPISDGAESGGPLRVERHALGVVELVLADPERRNAMTAEMTQAWVAAVDDLRTDADARCVLVRSEGTAFCAGGDVGFLARQSGDGVGAVRAAMMPFYRSWLSLLDVELPVVAAVQGPAVGAGAALALMADVRVASDGARLSLPFVRLGLHPGMATTWLLRQASSPAVARDLLLTGRTVRAEEMLRLGLVSSVHPADELEEQARERAAQIAAAAPVAVRLTTLALRSGHPDREAALEWEGLAQAVTLASDDVREGLAARAEKRPPRFTGR